MAKQKSVLQFRGKLGQVVGMKNGFGGTEGFARAYVADPKNPQTAGQTAQRIRLLPAVNFRRQLQSVIARAWEGTKYGGASTRKFMKYALKEPLTNIPQLMKDESLAIPGKYLVSRGSLAPITTECSGQNLIFGLGCGDWGQGADSKKTLGYLSRMLIQYNSGVIENGDQLTVVCCYSTDASNAPLTTVLYTIASVVLDIDSNVAVSDIDSGFKAIDEGFAFSRNKRLLGGCIVLSREGAANLRNTTRFELNESDTQLMSYFGSVVKAEVRASYTKSANATSLDWPYEAEEGDSAESDGPFVITVASSDQNKGTVTGGGTYYRGDIVTCNATPKSGYDFNGWTINGEDAGSDNPLQLTVTGNTNLVALFTEEDRP